MVWGRCVDLTLWLSSPVMANSVEVFFNQFPLFHYVSDSEEEEEYGTQPI